MISTDRGNWECPTMNFLTATVLALIALALMADRALAAEPQMPESFQGTWCGNGEFPGESSYYSGRCPKREPDPDRCYDRSSNPGYTYYRAECVIKPEPDPDPYFEIEITATGANSPAVSCVVRQVTKFDVCPWGMIFKNRERARALRSFQINPWGPGYHIVLQCTNASKRSKTIRTDWVMEKGSITIDDMPRNYRCPWNRRGAR
jgi:hypothetical protein